MEEYHKHELENAINQVKENMKGKTHEEIEAAAASGMHHCMYGDAPLEDREFMYEEFRKILEEAVIKNTKTEVLFEELKKRGRIWD